MPYAQMHYPFENKEAFEASFPGDFIAEGLDQTRGNDEETEYSEPPPTVVTLKDIYALLCEP